MPDESPAVPPQPPVEPAPEAPRPQIPFDIGEEFGTAKKNLPPYKILIVGVIALAVVFAIVSFFTRPKTTGLGSIDDITAVEIPDQKAVMVAINVSFQNQGPKPFWIHSMSSSLETASGTLKDDAASGADFDRYFQAFPDLKAHALAPLKLEDKIEPGASTKGTVIVSFPVTKDDFDKRKSLKVDIWPYDQAVPLELTK
ncbi:MAG TPA: hypothetical protein VJQ82_08155 [Terriglobales bacterium]|nr:hypothetical protein [Terriglobales bacterium]